MGSNSTAYGMAQKRRYHHSGGLLPLFCDGIAFRR
jgi:hypothetical protein